MNNNTSPEIIIVRPEIKAQLTMEVYNLDSVDETLEYDLNNYEGLDLAVSDDEMLMDFRLAVYSTNC